MLSGNRLSKREPAYLWNGIAVDKQVKKKKQPFSIWKDLFLSQ